MRKPETVCKEASMHVIQHAALPQLTVLATWLRYSPVYTGNNHHAHQSNMLMIIQQQKTAYYSTAFTLNMERVITQH